MDIKIGKSARVCVACERDFVHDELIHSALRTQDGEFKRADYCTKCWMPDGPQSSYSCWELNYYDPNVAEQAPAESFSPLRKLFYDSVESEGRGALAVAYLAAQLLRRQKVFRHIKETEDAETGLTLILFNDRIGNRLIEVRDPSLGHAELDAGRLALIEELNRLEGPEGPAEETEGAPGATEHDVEQQPETAEA